MRLFIDKDKARNSLADKQKLWMNSECPFNPATLCGSWCSLFYSDKIGEDSKTYVILGCKGSDKQLYVDEIIE
jgi:hypothetical protein